MSTIRIDKKHANLLNKLIATLTLRSKKISKKKLIGRLIEEALISEGISLQDELPPLENDPAWKGLKKTFKTGIKDLSERVDEFIYFMNEDQ